MDGQIMHLIDNDAHILFVRCLVAGNQISKKIKSA